MRRQPLGDPVRLASHTLHQQLARPRPDLVQRQVHRRQARVHKRHLLDVVKTYDGHVLGHPPAALDEPVPGGARYAYVWGSALTMSLVVQALTGWLLMTAYAPSATTAVKNPAATLGRRVRRLTARYSGHVT